MHNVLRSGPGVVRNSNSELPESIICIMYRGSGPGCVQNSNSEHLRGTIYYKIHRMEAKGRPNVTGTRVGRREPPADRSSKISIRDLQISAGVQHALHPEGWRRIASPSGHPPTLSDDCALIFGGWSSAFGLRSIVNMNIIDC